MASCHECLRSRSGRFKRPRCNSFRVEGHSPAFSQRRTAAPLPPALQRWAERLNPFRIGSSPGELLADADRIHYDMGASEKDEEEATRKAVDFSTTASP